MRPLSILFWMCCSTLQQAPLMEHRALAPFIVSGWAAPRRARCLAWGRCGDIYFPWPLIHLPPCVFSGIRSRSSRHQLASVTSGLTLPHFTLVLNKSAVSLLSQRDCLLWKRTKQNFKHIWTVSMELTTQDQPAAPHWWSLVHVTERKKHCRFYRIYTLPSFHLSLELKIVSAASSPVKYRSRGHSLCYSFNIISFFISWKTLRGCCLAFWEIMKH